VSDTVDDGWQRSRRQIIAQAISIGVATGAYGISFGAISVAAGLDFLQTVALSLLLFSGASQFALVGVIASGGNPLAGAVTAAMLGSRNTLYGLRVGPVLRVRGWRRFLSSQLVIDESTAMSIREPERAARLGFYATGFSVFVLWNIGTAAGALGANALQDPSVLGFDAAVAGAFLALLGPQLRARESWAVALSAALVAVLVVPIVPPGIPVLLAAVVAIAFSFLPDGNER
jgi:predicted branched-subunit amino acid permease